MLIDAQIITPYLVVIITAALALAGFFFKSITTKLSDLSNNLADLAVKIATLIEHNNNTDGAIGDIKKYHNEIIDLKAASAELNERTITTRNQLNLIQSRLDDTISRR